MAQITPTSRTQIKRVPARGVYDRDIIDRILDHGFVCHVAFVFDDKPICLPMVYGRSGDAIYLHGSTASRLMRALRDGAEAAVTVTHLDALVLGRSAFHSSVNYRSVAVFGQAEEVTDAKEKVEALETVVEHAIPGRWDDVRGPDLKEFHQTMVLKLSIDEVSAKVRSGHPVDEPDDYALDCWAGIIPMRVAFDAPVADPVLRDGIETPAYTTSYRRPGGSDAESCLARMAERAAG